MFKTKKQNEELRILISEKNLMIDAFLEESDKLEKEVIEKTEILTGLTKKLSGIETTEIKDDFDTEKETKDVFSKISEMNIGIEMAKAILKNFSNSINQISVATCEVAASVNEIATTIKNSGSIATNMVEIAQSGIEMSKKTSDSSITIQLNYEKIMTIILFLKDISVDIRNMSFNASIQAAHAGNYGKGFSVIAEEIKNLSDKISNEIKNIEKIIKENKAKVDEGVIDAKNTESKFDAISELAIQNKNNSDETINATSEINTAINQTSVLLSEIAANSNGIKKEFSSIENKEDQIKILIDQLVKVIDIKENDFVKDLIYFDIRR